jgi:Leu/Phe-tRNA-protein transferase
VLFDDYFYYAKDIACFGSPLTVDNLKAAYRLGIFPWHIDGLPLPWYCPAKRAILEFADLHVPKSLEKALRKSDHTVTFDKDFRRVIESCSHTPRAGESGTWITDEFIDVYTKLYYKGMAHSVDLTAVIPHGDGQTILREVLVLADHNAYHLGQIMLLRRIFEAQTS